MIPVAAPLERIAVHIAQAPGIRPIAADRRRPAKRRPRLTTAVWPPFDLGLLAAESVHKLARRTPAQLHAGDGSLFAGMETDKGIGCDRALRRTQNAQQQHNDTGSWLAVGHGISRFGRKLRHRLLLLRGNIFPGGDDRWR